MQRDPDRMPTPVVVLVALLAASMLGVTVAACTGASDAASTPSLTAPSLGSDGHADAADPLVRSPSTAVVLPTVDRPYAHTGPGDVAGPAAQARRLVYVPNQVSGTVQVIDPATYQVVARYRVAASPEHVVPSYDRGRLWVNSDAGNTLTPIDPATGQPGSPVAVPDPYNLYFSPNGRYALVMSERLRAIQVRDPQTMAAVRSLPLPGCGGVNHADVTADLTMMVASCEFTGQLVVVDADATRVVKTIDLNAIATPGATAPDAARRMGGPAARLALGASSMPQDVRLSPDGRWFLAADMIRNGVWVIDAHTLTVDHFIRTGFGAHGIYPSRDATTVYISNRDEGSVTLLDASTLAEKARWSIPGGGSPDMGGVSVDGTELWLSGRYNSTVYVFDTRTGQVAHTIPVDSGPHGLLVWPQPGRFSLGHTGNMR